MRVGQKRTPRISVRIPPRDFSAAISVINRVLERQVIRELIDDVMFRWNLPGRYIDVSIFRENRRGYIERCQDSRTPERAPKNRRTDHDAANQEKTKFTPPAHRTFN